VFIEVQKYNEIHFLLLSLSFSFIAHKGKYVPLWIYTTGQKFGVSVNFFFSARMHEIDQN